jgi:hypothetical protein
MKNIIQHLIFAFCLFTPSIYFPQSFSVTSDPSSFSVESFSGIGWNNCNNSNVSDDLRANSGIMIGIVTTNTPTDLLRTESYGFSIPSTAVICGIEIQIEKRATGLMIGSSVRDYSLQLMKSGLATGTLVANSNDWTGSDQITTYGGSSDLWGTTWTPADINSSGFGCLFSVRLTSGIAGIFLDAQVDHVQITIHYTVSPLAIDLVYFDASVMDNRNVKLKWITETEQNNDHFVIQHSTDAINWKDKGTIPGAGNSSSRLNYECVDDETSSGLSYYRLKQVDHDGTTNYHEVVSVIIPEQLSIVPFPNPGHNSIFFNCSGNDDVSVVIALYDIQWNLVKQTEKYHLKKGDQNPIEIQISDLKKGMYFYKALLNDEVITGQIVKEN